MLGRQKILRVFSSIVLGLVVLVTLLIAAFTIIGCRPPSRINNPNDIKQTPSDDG